MNILHKFALISWIFQWICLVAQIITGHEILFFVINILFLNTTMAFLIFGNRFAYGGLDE